MRVWITKYALTKGIFDVDASVPGNDMAFWRINGWSQFAHDEGRDWHRSLDGAKARAEEMRLAKIKSLQKKIAKLEKLKF